MAAKKAPKSREDRQRERELRALIRARAAESRGRRVGPAISEYEALLCKGDERIAQALISRHNVRMGNIAKTFDDYRFAVMSAIVPIIQLDGALRVLGENPRRPPTHYVGSMPDLLSWGVDSVVAAARLLLSGQILGAAAMIRNQLERWVTQRAANLGLEPEADEPTAAFVARAWSHPDAFQGQWYEKHVEIFADLYEDAGFELHDDESMDHRHVYRSDGSDVCPALIYALLSEFLHLREFKEAPYWDAELLIADDDTRQSVVMAAGAVCDAIFLALREIRLSALEMAEGRRLESTVKMLSAGMDAISVSDQQTTLDYEAIPFGNARAHETIVPPLAALAPLLPREGLNGQAVAAVGRLADDYDAVRRGERPAGRLYRDDEFLIRAFAWHRRRSIGMAVFALEEERRMLGKAFDLDSLAGRAERWVLLTEAASMLAIWHQNPGVKVAASALASSLRSAYWLWLEDDDRAMAILRSCLEYAACLRTWRKKPDKAAKLAARHETTPRDWIETAGWKRLGLLNRALGEFAHARKMEKWPAARQLLVDLQINVDAEKAMYTARGAAIDFTSSLAAREVVMLVSEVSADVSAAIGRILQGLDFELREDAADVEAHFAHIWALRTRQSNS